MTVPDEPEYLAATRAGYDTVAADYAALLADALADNPFDRAVLALYAELVRGAASGEGAQQVVDVGCGPGRITAHLAGLGLNVFGIDLSPAMIEQARRRHPGLEFRVGQMTALDLPPGSVAGLVAWYCVIHVPPAEHPVVFSGFRRALAPGGHLLLAFHAGDERRRITAAYGHSGLAFDAYRLPPERVEQQAVRAGFLPVARFSHAPIGPEKTAQAYLILRAGEGAG
ncbi:class I SAM-dependent methyltransferase [Actinocrinis puniceicyclus]|uniref:Class I SAM-dependent methyltransferase n=1 Tax=Actinocrinis puniceicyclus TaxID=977794 RepID=A0A8J8BEP1_9ACTN|nr:class I SAM-dependent methyltransferase [Actinocrinis puniceicyclus]MBS2966593.1 class I SAM-dependent methyltransferase [Actinocrinis puniceicyclus]